MQTKAYIQIQFDFLHTSLLQVTEGLTAEELSWRPGEATSIGFIMLHIVFSQDNNIMKRYQAKPLVWDSGKWYETFHLAPDETPFDWDAEKLASFKLPSLKTMLAYTDAVQAETNAYFAALTETELDSIINVSYLGDLPIGKLISRMAVHISGHIGEISYIRGLKRGMNK